MIAYYHASTFRHKKSWLAIADSLGRAERRSALVFSDLKSAVLNLRCASLCASGVNVDAATPSGALFQEASYISFPVENGDNLKGGRRWPVHNGVVRITGERPETQRTGGEVGTGMAARGGLGNQRASVINRLFYAVGGVFAVIGNVTPDVKNVGFGKRRESINAHRLDKRQSSFIT